MTRDEGGGLFVRSFTSRPKMKTTPPRVFNLARQDVAGFGGNTQPASRPMFDQVDGTLCDLMEGLFYIAVADGSYSRS